ncbi:hypothetical protein TIFTF001_014921 [Ficus carica]|uniref:Uncharacterized protein n=1 Tax=Ficus carica TaxID=3494 RepID=A0AA88D4K9_FICCA|nr:hypothetical protein TIFTF001_014921 [Ficus carica]
MGLDGSWRSLDGLRRRSLDGSQGRGLDGLRQRSLDGSRRRGLDGLQRRSLDESRRRGLDGWRVLLANSSWRDPSRATHEFTGANISSGGEGVRLGHDLRLSRRWAAGATNTDPAVGGGFSGGRGLDIGGAWVSGIWLAGGRRRGLGAGGGFAGRGAAGRGVCVSQARPGGPGSGGGSPSPVGPGRRSLFKSEGVKFYTINSMANDSPWSHWQGNNQSPNSEPNTNSGDGKAAKFKQKVREKLAKTKAVASSGVKKVKDGTSSGVQWIKDKCHEIKRKH